MTNKTITLTVPNDDAIALHHLGEAMQRMAGAHGFGTVTEYDTMGTILTRNKIQDEKHNVHVEGTTTGLVAEPVEQELLRTEEPEQCECDVSDVADMSHIERKIPVSQGGTAPDTDSTGTPWDERIHAESRALNADGTWRARRKPKDIEQAEWEQYVEDVKAELSVELPETDQSETPDDVEPEHVAPAPVAPPVVTPPPVTAPVGDLPTDFIGLLQWLTGNGFNSVVVDPVLKSRDLPNLTALKDTPEMIPQFAQSVADYARGVE